MIQNEVTKLMAIVPLMLPRLIGQVIPDYADIKDEVAYLNFKLEEPLTIGLVMDAMEDDLEALLLYHGVDKNNKKQHQASFFKAESIMYIIHFVTDSREMVSDFTVSVFDSLDRMESEMEENLIVAEKMDCIQSMSKEDVLRYFCTID